MSEFLLVCCSRCYAKLLKSRLASFLVYCYGVAHLEHRRSEQKDLAPLSELTAKPRKTLHTVQFLVQLLAIQW